ncbi:hypothetical protein Tco_1007266 [Tanacetum coccineum]
MGANGGVKGVNGNVEGANKGAPEFSTIIAQQMQNLLPAMLAQVSNQGNVGNQNGNMVNENVQENVGNVIMNGNRVGCSYKEFLACNPKEYDGKGGIVVLTHWVEKMESVHDMSVMRCKSWNSMKISIEKSKNIKDKERNYQEESFTYKEEMAHTALSDSEMKIKKEKAIRISFKLANFEKSSKSLDKLIISQISDNNRKGVGYNAVPPPPTGLFAPPTIDLSNSGLEEFQQTEFEGYGLRANKSVCENSSNETKKNSDAPLIEEWVSNNEDKVESPVVVEKKTIVPTIPKVNVVKPKQQEKPVRKTVRYAKMYRSKGPRGNQRNWNNQKSQQLGNDFVMHNKACYGNPETELEDFVRLTSPEDKKVLKSRFCILLNSQHKVSISVILDLSKAAIKVLGCSEGCHISCKLLQRLSYRFQAAAKAATLLRRLQHC